MFKLHTLTLTISLSHKILWLHYKFPQSNVFAVCLQVKSYTYFRIFGDDVISILEGILLKNPLRNNLENCKTWFNFFRTPLCVKIKFPRCDFKFIFWSTDDRFLLKIILCRSAHQRIRKSYFFKFTSKPLSCTKLTFAFLSKLIVYQPLTMQLCT